MKRVERQATEGICFSIMEKGQGSGIIIQRLQISEEKAGHKIEKKGPKLEDAF